MVGLDTVDRPCVRIVHIDEGAVLTTDIDEAEIVVHHACVVRVGPEADSDCEAEKKSASIVDPSDLRLNRAREVLIGEVCLCEFFVVSEHGVALVGMSRCSTTKISRDHAKVINPEFLIERRILGISDILL